MATMRDVARRAGVSAKTVSRVFNHDLHVSLATRERVEVALRELNYVPSTLSTTFRSGRAPVMGVAVPDIADPFFGALAKAVEALAAVHGMSVVITSLGEDPAREPAIVQSLLRQSLSGLVIAPIAGDQSYLGVWAGRTQLVFVDRRALGVVADSFTEDDHAGARAATGHLVEHGHVRIGFLGDSTAIPTSRGRLVGYRAALLDAAIEYDESLVALGALDRASAAAAFSALERLEEPPTAIFASNARVTMSLVPVLRSDRRLALAGFGDFPMADMLEPSVTVIDQNPVALGTLAAQRILDRLAHPRRRYRRHTVLPVELVERASCFPTRRRG
ncbi:LacI family DNA-binding transcriptional regulator [Cellulomonas fengjieae]|uniref:LacI family DNA-binding transcriptional regulator n=1 Tax=Cellulomonas fengjieae TaxID=2819978 RepID=A0ABS3SJ23_9CELL|nr:LacI family DNA-binding transcriptional regulator [Cellulomonas fengjieae]MBO3085751.1 LacI family DNA-binding transcriptional regulator [Cellulomonas fengjieae]QVI67541.1 LacI family DNA-binding transcriptional regulator [Cellulomonas fengjieae]